MSPFPLQLEPFSLFLPLHIYNYHTKTSLYNTEFVSWDNQMIYFRNFPILYVEWTWLTKCVLSPEIIPNCTAQVSKKCLYLHNITLLIVRLHIWCLSGRTEVKAFSLLLSVDLLAIGKFPHLSWRTRKIRLPAQYIAVYCNTPVVKSAFMKFTIFCCAEAVSEAC